MDLKPFPFTSRFRWTAASRRSVLAILVGAILGTGNLTGSEARNSHKKHKKRKKTPQPGACDPDSATVTCSGKCGAQTNNCGQGVNCGSCPNACAGNPCGANGVCSLTAGSYTCTCAAGFIFNSVTCTTGCCPIGCGTGDPCGPHGTCSGSGATYTCSCTQGYVTNGLTCVPA
jgi:hypothetical protein